MLGAAGCGGGAGSTTPTTGGGGGTTPTTGTALVHDVSLSIAVGSTTSVKSDNSNSTNIVVLATDVNNAAVPNATVHFAADTGLLSGPTVITDSNGKGTISFSSGTNQTDRTATITATCNGLSRASLINITGSTLTASLASNAIVVGGTATTVTLTAKDASQQPIVGTQVTLSQSGAGAVSLTPATGTTDANGKFTATVTPVSTGTVTITATAAGTNASADVTITGNSVSAFAIDAINSQPYTAGTQVPLSLNTPMTVEANAPAGVTTVVFVATIGTFSNLQGSIAVPVVAGKATATYSSQFAGLATIEAYNQANPAQNATVDIGITSPTAYKITLQAQPTVIAKYTGGATHPQSSLVAYVTDQNNAPVGNAVVQFQILNPTGGGETLSPAIVTTATTPGNGVQLGQAVTTFYSGTLSSNQGNQTGTTIHATVVGTAVGTGTSPSGADALVVIGGTAGSVAISSGTTVASDATNTYYNLPMAVLVADSNNNPVAGATVSLAAWPLAFNTGGSCSIDPDTYTPASGGTPATGTGWFKNEDVNENLVLDQNEDGLRQFYSVGVPRTCTGSGASQVCTGYDDSTLVGTSVAGGTIDGKLTPVNSDGGTVPATVTTGANGVATFTLTYPKASGLHIYNRVTASTLVQGTETVGQTNFILPVLIADTQPCTLPASPWKF